MKARERKLSLPVDAWAGEFAGHATEPYFASVSTALDETVVRMRALAGTAKGLHYAKGDLAEAWHVGTFNADAARGGVNARATAPRDHSVVDVLLRGPSGTSQAQLKYFREAEASAKAISAPAYRHIEQKVVPADQLDEVRNAALRLAAKNAHNRPEMSDSYRHTAKVADDRLRMSGAQSRPLTEKDARALVQELRRNHDFDRARFGLTTQHFVQWQDILREAGGAAIDAAMIATVLNSMPHLLAVAQKAIRTGRMTEADFEPLRRALPAIALRSATCAGVSATIVGAARAGFLGSACLGLRTNFVGAGVALGVRALELSSEAWQGNITWSAAARLLTQDTFVMAAAVTGALLVAASLSAAPMLGSLVGNLVGAGLAQLVIARLDVVGANRTLPVAALDAAGFALIRPRSIELERFTVEQFRPTTLLLEA